MHLPRCKLRCGRLFFDLDLKTPDGFVEGLCIDCDLQTSPGQSFFSFAPLWMAVFYSCVDGGVEGLCTDLDLKTSLGQGIFAYCPVWMAVRKVNVQILA